MILGTILWIVGLFILLVLAHERGYSLGYKAGHEKGEIRGRDLERQWILHVEESTREAREKIWREEAS